VNAQQASFGDADGGAMKRPAITKKDDIADRVLNYQTVEKLRPLVLRTAKIHCSRESPKCAVTTVKINAVYGVTSFSERPTQTVKKPCRQPLQEQKAAVCRRNV